MLETAGQTVNLTPVSFRLVCLPLFSSLPLYLSRGEG